MRGLIGALGTVVALACCAKLFPSKKEAVAPLGPVWSPGTVYAASHEPNARGLVERRGIIHAHSIHSHDACDNAPHDDAGVPNAQCDEDFRAGICLSKHDFVFLTDHPDNFDLTEFPETLLYRPARGDTLTLEDGEPVANAAQCPAGDPVLLMAGCESGESMPVGLRHHVANTPSARAAIYNSLDPVNLLAQREAGAVNLVAHTEKYTVDQLVTLPLQGFEMFNLHANLFINVGTALQMLTDVGNHEPDVPHPDLSVFPLITEDSRYLFAWGGVLAAGARRVTTMGTDVHRNSFPQLLYDGERVDSYRRIMVAFSNHLLVRPQPNGTVTHVELQEALRAGRLYGVFEYAGYAQGFEYGAVQNGATLEMGEEVNVGAVLHVSMPQVQNLDPRVEPPRLTARILKAVPSGFEEVAAGPGNLDFTVTLPGAYRAEIRMQARHLRALLGYDRATLVEKDMPWVYSNAIYVVP